MSESKGINTLAMVAASLTAIVAQEAQTLHSLIQAFEASQRQGTPTPADEIVKALRTTKTNLFQATSDAQNAINDVATARAEAAKAADEAAKVPAPAPAPVAPSPVAPVADIEQLTSDADLPTNGNTAPQ